MARFLIVDETLFVEEISVVAWYLGFRRRTGCGASMENSLEEDSSVGVRGVGTRDGIEYLTSRFEPLIIGLDFFVTIFPMVSSGTLKFKRNSFECFDWTIP